MAEQKKNTPEREDSVFLRHKLLLQLVFKCNSLNIKKGLTMLCLWGNGWYWAYYPATNKWKSRKKYAKLLFAAFVSKHRLWSLREKKHTSERRASRSSLLLPESIFQTLAQGLEPTWRPQALWTEKRRQNSVLNGCDLGKGQHRAAGKGVQKSVWFSCALGLLRVADAWGPERTAMGGWHRADSSVQRCWGHWNLVPVRLDWQAVAWESGPLLGVSISSGETKWK